MTANSDCYHYDTSGLSCVHEYLLPAVEKIVSARKPQRIFDLGCGNGSVANKLCRYAPVSGIDISRSAVQIANHAFPHLNIEAASVYDDLAATYGRYPVVISLEVVEHLYDPRTYADRLFDLVEPGGIAIVSTPYHGYWKNLALALTGSLDAHFTALWDGGHIKFWSINTLRTLLSKSGFSHIEFLRVGRIPLLAKSMIAVAKKSNGT